MTVIDHIFCGKIRAFSSLEVILMRLGCSSSQSKVAMGQVAESISLAMYSPAAG